MGQKISIVCLSLEEGKEGVLASLQADLEYMVLVFLSLHGEHSEKGAHPHGNAPCELTAGQAQHRVTGIRRQLDNLGRHLILSWN